MIHAFRKFSVRSFPSGKIDLVKFDKCTQAFNKSLSKTVRNIHLARNSLLEDAKEITHPLIDLVVLFKQFALPQITFTCIDIIRMKCIAL